VPPEELEVGFVRDFGRKKIKISTGTANGKEPRKFFT
jgi:hypothetical protein